MTAQHTPAPWAVGKIDGTCIFAISQDGKRTSVADTWHEDNAAMIVKAVNAHQVLVDALTEIKGWTNASLTFGSDGNYRSTVRDVLVRASQALTAAEAA
jgi:hypothetical protein